MIIKKEKRPCTVKERIRQFLFPYTLEELHENATVVVKMALIAAAVAFVFS